MHAFFADPETLAESPRDSLVTADELQRAVQPLVGSIQRSQAGNEYWLRQLAGAQTDPRRLEAIREGVTGLQKVTSTDLQRVARQYLANAKAYRLVVVPEAAVAASQSR